MKNKPYIIGTRGSLLALTQCLQMKNIMEEKGLGEFKLKIISTQGDENTQAPLWQLEGKDFFTKELDAALLQGEVDLVVHSYKDLGSERPEGIKLATITERKYAHDILFIKNETIEKLKNKELKKFVVGTSSPRRMTNISRFLPDYLPFGSELGIEVECSPLRGNVKETLMLSFLPFRVLKDLLKDSPMKITRPLISLVTRESSLKVSLKNSVS